MQHNTMVGPSSWSSAAAITTSHCIGRCICAHDTFEVSRHFHVTIVSDCLSARQKVSNLIVHALTDGENGEQATARRSTTFNGGLWLFTFHYVVAANYLRQYCKDELECYRCAGLCGSRQTVQTSALQKKNEILNSYCLAVIKYPVVRYGSSGGVGVDACHYIQRSNPPDSH